MAFDSLINRLIPEGAVMAGQRPKVITSPEGEPGYHQTDKLSTLLRGMEAFQAEAQVDEEARMKKAEKKFDMYKTLRSSGYDPARAFKAVGKMDLPDEPGGATDSERKADAEVKKTEAQTEKIKKETDMMSVNKADLTKRILNKIANDEALTPGEQKVYDEVIKKYGKKSSLEEDLESGGAASKPATGDGEYVPMMDPKGKKKKVHPEDVEKALKKGWKKR